MTIDDAVYVIDSGVQKEKTYNCSTRMSALVAQQLTKANLIQRKGSFASLSAIFDFWEFWAYISELGSENLRHRRKSHGESDAQVKKIHSSVQRSKIRKIVPRFVDVFFLLV